MQRPEIEETHLRYFMLFLFDKGLKSKEATQTICDIYGDILDTRKCYRWFKKFKSGDRSLKDKPKTGRPLKIDDDTLNSLVESDPRKTIHELSQDLGCPRTTVQNHLKRLGKKNRQGVWVPHELSPTAIEQRVTICSSLLSRNETDPFLRRIVTGDEKWVLYSNSRRKKNGYHRTRYLCLPLGQH
jgi:[histone H3]-lysine36 N-dimethyltransferase SETMAR